MPPAEPRRRRLRTLVLFLLPAAAALAAGCGEGGERRDLPAPADGARARATPVAPDTGRDGSAFVAVYPSGPYEEIRVVRATDGAIVAGGSTRFPDGTRIGVTLLREGPAGTEPVATSRVTVELGRFMSAPLAPYGGTPAAGLHRLRFTVSFGPADQPPEVLRAAEEGRRFEGPGASRGPDGRIVHEIVLEAPL